MAARRAHLLEFAVLGLLAEAPAHGYELRRQLNEALGPFRALSYGTLYPALKSLLGQGLIAQSETSVTASGRRPRIVYELTVAGREHLSTLLSHIDATAWEDEGFDVRVHFFPRTRREVRLRILQGRRAALQEQAQQLEQEMRRITELIEAEHRRT